MLLYVVKGWQVRAPKGRGVGCCAAWLWRLSEGFVGSDMGATVNWSKVDVSSKFGGVGVAGGLGTGGHDYNVHVAF